MFRKVLFESVRDRILKFSCVICTRGVYVIMYYRALRRVVKKSFFTMDILLVVDDDIFDVDSLKLNFILKVINKDLYYN